MVQVLQCNILYNSELTFSHFGCPQSYAHTELSAMFCSKLIKLHTMINDPSQRQKEYDENSKEESPLFCKDLRLCTYRIQVYVTAMVLQYTIQLNSALPFKTLKSSTGCPLDSWKSTIQCINSRVKISVNHHGALNLSSNILHMDRHPVEAFKINNRCFHCHFVLTRLQSNKANPSPPLAQLLHLLTVSFIEKNCLLVLTVTKRRLSVCH